MAFETKATIASFGGQLLKLQHDSTTPPPTPPTRALENEKGRLLMGGRAQGTSTKTPMAVNLFLPPQASGSDSAPVPAPVVFYLSGLTCTADNCAEKGFLQRHAAKHGIAIVYPDTSPRGAGIAGEDDSWDFGTGAGFYVDATAAPWSASYRMYSYVVHELPDALFAHFARQLDGSRVSLMGHSMGGHGALTLFLKNPGRYRSVSAFAPIANPMRCAWGQKAFGGYFGAADTDTDADAWKAHDATELVVRWPAAEHGPFRALIDVGTGDSFYKAGQLLPENFERAATQAGAQVQVRYQPVCAPPPPPSANRMGRRDGG